MRKSLVVLVVMMCFIFANMAIAGEMYSDKAVFGLFNGKHIDKPLFVMKYIDSSKKCASCAGCTGCAAAKPAPAPVVVDQKPVCANCTPNALCAACAPCVAPVMAKCACACHQDGKCLESVCTCACHKLFPKAACAQMNCTCKDNCTKNGVCANCEAQMKDHKKCGTAMKCDCNGCKKAKTVKKHKKARKARKAKKDEASKIEAPKAEAPVVEAPKAEVKKDDKK